MRVVRCLAAAWPVVGVCTVVRILGAMGPMGLRAQGQSPWPWQPTQSLAFAQAQAHQTNFITYRV